MTKNEPDLLSDDDAERFRALGQRFKIEVPPGDVSFGEKGKEIHRELVRAEIGLIAIQAELSTLPAFILGLIDKGQVKTLADLRSALERMTALRLKDIEGRLEEITDDVAFLNRVTP